MNGLLNVSDKKEGEEEFSFKNYFIPLTIPKAISWICIIGVIVYFNTFFNGFVWDDYPQLLNNPLLHSWINIIPIFTNHSHTFYRPFSDSIFAGMYSLFGTTSFLYHFFQVVLQIVIAILIFFLFNKFFKISVSFFLALIYLVHPMQVETVAYISSFQNELSMVFGLLAIFIITKEKRQSLYKYCLFFIFLLIASLSKELGLLFGVFVLVFMKCNQQQTFTKKDYLQIGTTYLLVILTYLYLRFLLGGTTSLLLQNTSIPIIQASFFVKLLTLPKILFYYLATFVYPKDLAISQQWVVKTTDMQHFYLPLIFVASFFISLFAGLFYLIKAKSKELHSFIFFLVWFLLSWMVAWQIIPLEMTVADRWFYFPMVGLLGLLGILLNQIQIKDGFVKKFFLVVMILVVSAYSIRTIIRVQNWSNGITLYSHDEVISNQSYDLENELAYEYLLLHDFNDAKPHIDKSIALAPHFWENWGNLGVYYEGKGTIDKSINAFSISIENNPNYYSGYLNLARVYYFYHKLPQATLFLQKKALIHFPNDPYFWSLKGVIDYRLGNKQQGMSEEQKAYQLSPDNTYLSLYNLMQNNQDLTNFQ